MNREIKFRAWGEINSQMIYEGGEFGNYVHSYDILKKYETVMQFTGLTDQNGKEIYEGDIVKTIFQYHDTFKEDIAVIEYDTLNPCFVMSYKFQGNGHDCHEYDFVCVGLRKNEVIGNIHHNPELLK